MATWKPRLASAILAALLAGCVGVPTVRFKIKACDAAGTPVPSIVVIGNEWPKSVAEVTRTPATINLTFEEKSITVTVQSLTFNDKGEIERGYRASDRTQYRCQSRELRADDPHLQLFILDVDYDYGT